MDMKELSTANLIADKLKESKNAKERIKNYDKTISINLGMTPLNLDREISDAVKKLVIELLNERIDRAKLELEKI